MRLRFPLILQADSCDCGVASLAMIAELYGIPINYENLRQQCQLSRIGVSMLTINEQAQRLGFKTEAVQLDFDNLQAEEIQMPCIVFWNSEHFIVVRRITRRKVLVADPGLGLLAYSHEQFKQKWCCDGDEGFALLMTPPDPKTTKTDTTTKTSVLKRLILYAKSKKAQFVKAALLLVLASLLQLLIPFLTQAIVDMGVAQKDINLLITILLAQGGLIVGRTVADFGRQWLTLKISAHINIAMISDFIEKLLHLPMPFFETKSTSDIIQRIYDFDRIDDFITQYSMSFLFAIVSLIVFGAVLAVYSLKIFVIFLIGSTLYLCWILLFVRRRRVLDNTRFDRMSKTQLHTIEIAEGASEIRLRDGQTYFKGKWRDAQEQVYDVNFKSLRLEQHSELGAMVINESKNLLMTFAVASMVINGQLTLGTMLAVQYIIGQMNSPLDQMVNFVNRLQDTKLSLERIADVTDKADENENAPISTLENCDEGIIVRNVSFAYNSAPNDLVLNNINIHIPKGKITAIVGSSGSGKSTLLKLILQYYKPQQGGIYINDTQNGQLTAGQFRKLCGCVMQDGYIFSDTIVRNIVMNEMDEDIDYDRLESAAKAACIYDFIKSLPIGFMTKIGMAGIELSKGQKQRLLIARAIYANPDYLFFDEATNSLDTVNEKMITDNLQDIYKGRTVLIIAHRLSTVRNADQIIVLEKGNVVETGSHDKLIEQKGCYYNLIRNQLELES